MTQPDFLNSSWTMSLLVVSPFIGLIFVGVVCLEVVPSGSGLRTGVVRSFGLSCQFPLARQFGTACAHRRV